jgi:transposase
MSKKIFSEQEIEILRDNKYVKRVGPKGITYTDEMKHFTMAEIEKGSLSPEIFEKAGFDISILGIDRVYSSVKRWKAAYKTSGIMGLQDTRKKGSGRPLKRELTLEEENVRLKAKNKFLEVQLELQKKLDMIERGVYIHKRARIKK